MFIHLYLFEFLYPLSITILVIAGLSAESRRPTPSCRQSDPERAHQQGSNARSQEIAGAGWEDDESEFGCFPERWSQSFC